MIILGNGRGLPSVTSVLVNVKPDSKQQYWAKAVTLSSVTAVMVKVASDSN